MNLLPSDESLYMRFDAYCKKYMKFANYKLFCEEQKRKGERAALEKKAKTMRKQDFYVYDAYPGLEFGISLENINVVIEDEVLYQALLMIPEERLEIILLSYFGDLTDKEISKVIMMPKSSVQYNRNAGLRQIKKIMEGYTRK